MARRSCAATPLVARARRRLDDGYGATCMPPPHLFRGTDLAPKPAADEVVWSFAPN